MVKMSNQKGENEVKVAEIVDSKSKNLTKSEGSVKQKSIRKYLNKDEMVKRLENLEGGRDKIICLFLWLTGCRVSEVVSVKKKDIDFKHNTIKIEWLKNRRQKERIIYMPKRLKNVLEVYTSTKNKDDRLFPITRQRVHQICKNKMGIHPHVFRHSYAVNFLRQGGRVTVLKQILGHSRLDTTMKYVKLVPRDVAEEIEKIDFF